VRLFLHELRGELKLYARSRELAFFTFVLPLLFFLILGSAYGDEDIDGYRGADYLLTGMIGYGAAATAFAGLAIVVVIRREEGILKRLRATPLPAPTYLAALLGTTILAFLVEVVVLVALGTTFLDAAFPKAVFSLVLALLLGASAFAALGVGLTTLIRRAEGASAVINAIYLPLSFLSGAFFSQHSFPRFLTAIADLLPLSYFIDLMGAITLDGRAIWQEPLDVAVIAAWGVAGAVLAIRRFRWVPTEG
jgi:ABC-2 type transport system permease protein